jgi:hypothetical protein
VEKAKGIYIVYDLENDVFFSYHDLIDYVLILVLNDFYQIKLVFIETDLKAGCLTVRSNF